MYVNGVDQGHEVGIRVPSYDGVRLHSFLSVHSIFLIKYFVR